MVRCSLVPGESFGPCTTFKNRRIPVGELLKVMRKLVVVNMAGKLPFGESWRFHELHILCSCRVHHGQQV